MHILLSLLVAIIGFVMYWRLANPKFAEIGRLMFFAGILAFLLQSAGAFLHFGVS